MDLTCPFCNSLFPAASAGRSPRGLVCPRCGEPLPPDLQPTTAITAAVVERPQAAKRRLPNYLIGLAILGVMITMALVALEFALRTQEFRRRNDFKIAQAKPFTLRQPAQWSGLGYLPTSVNLLAGIHVSELVKDPQLDRFTALPRLVQFALAKLDKSAGLRFEDIDHIVLGVNLDDKIPQATIVVQTLKPFDADAVAKALHAARAKDLHDQPLYAYPLQPLGQGRLWCPGPHTAVFVLRPDAVDKTDLKQLPFPPRTDNKGFAEPLVAALDQRLGKRPLSWLAGHGDFSNLTLLPALGKNVPVGARELDILTHVQTLGIALGEGRVTGHLFTGNEPNMLAVQKKLDALKLPTLRVTATGDGPDAFWVSFQANLPEPEAKK